MNIFLHLWRTWPQQLEEATG